MRAHTLRAVLTIGLAALLLAGCERPPMQTTQQGFRGTAMQQTVNPRTAAARQAELPPVPMDLPAPPDGPGPRAKDIYQNVKVLGDLPVADFVRHMTAITQWIAPNEGCTYCHNPANLAEDSKYTKVVARRMIEMTRNLNGNWKQHVAETGVTCYTCHRGQPVPARVWFKADTPKMNASTFIGNDFGQNKAIGAVALTSLPYDPYSSYLVGKDEIRVYSPGALPQKELPRAPIQTAEKSYALMMHMSEGLGVNCTFCHNSQAFSQWIPKRVTAWHGIRMAREMNNDYMVPLTATFPPNRLGPTGDVAKVYCATCHQGVNKPLAGLQQAKLYAGLQAAPPEATASAAADAKAPPTKVAAAGKPAQK
ncbi:MAG: photosynthetic reaction center cytochrome PufC [Rubrivivax sp.]